MKSFGLRNACVPTISTVLLILASTAPPTSAQVPAVVKVFSSANPAVQGQKVTFTAGVNWTQTEAPSGTITLNDTCSGSSTVAALGTISLGSATSGSPGAGTLDVSSFPCVGGNSIVASYSGDSDYLAGVSQPLIETVLTQFTPTGTSLSLSSSAPTAGQTVTFSARLSFALTANTYATGKVTFTDTKTGSVLGSGNVQTSGGRTEVLTGASFASSSLAAGSYNVVAAYSGDNIYGPSTSTAVDLTVSGSAGPTISSVVTTQGNQVSQNLNIAQNTWIEIHGTNLAQAPEDWSKQDFSKGLPTTLGGVSAMVNNKPAAIFYVSPTQVNILTPLDDSLGQVPLQLSTPSGNTPTVTPTMLQAAPSFLALDAAGHVAARHLDYTLAGPVSLSAPGYAFTPVKPGETVLLYAVGFGQTSPPITDQLTGLGALPALPVVDIGGLPATVIDAAIASAGLYQLKVVVPLTAPDGDLILMASGGGSSTQSGVVLTVQH